MARPTYPSDKADKTLVRFPEGMHGRLKEEAVKNNRSLNAEIIARLEASLSGDGLDAASLARALDESNALHQKQSALIAQMMEVMLNVSLPAMTSSDPSPKED